LISGVPNPAALDFPPLHCSLDAPLGDYYQDFLPALKLAECGYHGTIDARGIPRVRLGNQGEHYLAVTVGQYALANASAVIRGAGERTERLRALCDWLVDNQHRGSDDAGLWTMGFDNLKYPWLRRPWVSALAQGNAISALLRGAELLRNQRYADAARAGYEALHVQRRHPLLVVDTGDELWYEEYPSDVPLHVLNGHVYTLFGILDVARTFRDSVALSRWRRGVATVAKRLPEFDVGYWSAYDLRTKELVDVHYHKNIHIPQLRILEALQGDPVFAEYAARWERYLANPLARARRVIGMRLRGLRKRVQKANRQ
jgi:heparosan-N-sulfate-glucuronate 5-epimerase